MCESKCLNIYSNRKCAVPTRTAIRDILRPIHLKKKVSPIRSYDRNRNVCRFIYQSINPFDDFSCSIIGVEDIYNFISEDNQTCDWKDGS